MLLNEIKNIVSTEKEARKFGVQIGTFLAIVSIILFVLQKNYAFYFFFIGVLLIIIGNFLPRILILPNRIWMIIGIILGFYTSRLILFILFYLIISPISFIAKIFGKDFLDEKLNRQQDSYWNLREKKSYDKSQTEKQY